MLLHGSFVQPDNKRAVGLNFFNDLSSCFAKPLIFRHITDHPHPLGICRAVKFTRGTDLDGPGGSDKLGQAHGCVRREKADLYFRLTELSASSGNDNITGDGQFHSTAETIALNGCNDGHFDLFAELENTIEGGNHIIHILRFVIGNFHSGTKVFAFSIEDHTFQVIILQKRFQQAVEFVHHFNIHHVEFRAVEGYAGDTVSLFKFKMRQFGHCYHSL